MRVLILSCATGGGHNDAARGVAQALTARGHEAVLMDHYLGLVGGAVDTAVCQGYVETVRRAPQVFRALYGIGRGASAGFSRLGVPSPVYWANVGLAEKLRALLEQEHFDAVVMTHLFPAQTLTHLKRHGARVPMTVGVFTDYTVIPFWEETDCDWYMVPDAATAAAFMARGVSPDKLLPMGIPAPAAFTPRFDRAAVRASLGFDPAKKYILVMGGSMGAGDLPGLVRQLRRAMGDGRQLIVITGSNLQMHEDLTRQYAGDPRVEIVGRLAVTAPYLQACDLLYTKPGGLTTTELLLSAKLVAPPGTHVQYCCAGYLLLGQLLECLYGQTLADLATQEVFWPLRMTRTGYLPSGDNIAPTERQADGTLLRGSVHDEGVALLEEWIKEMPQQ